ncbi:MAG: hypothetical protein JNM38_20625 [Acidobacteria bacterium]|nr:hypothetical protein [Acidobacteriota bacterium]
MTTPARPAPRWAWAAVAGAASLPFLPVLWAWFGADDFAFIYIIRLVPEFGAFLWRDFVENFSNTAFYRPLGMLGLYLDLRLGGGEAWLPHLSNLIVHVATAVGVFRLALLLAPRGSSFVPALIGAAAFAASPRRVEAVAWVSCRPDLLATCFTVWAANFAASGRARSSVATWGLALLGKESTAAMPLALASSSMRPDAAWHVPTLVRRLVPYAMLAVAYLAIRRVLVGSWIGGYGTAQHTPTVGDLDNVAKYFAYSLLPPLESLSHAIREPLVRGATGAAVLAGCGVAALFAFRARHAPAVRVGAIWFACAVLPVLSLAVSLTSPLNDRLLYLPSVGVALVVSGFAWLARPAVAALAAVLIAAGGIVTAEMSNRWREAGPVTERWLRGVAEISRPLPASCAVWITAAPDSLGGAYVLRSGWRFALHMLDSSREPADIRQVTLYLQQDPDVVPVVVRMTGPGEVEVASAGPTPEVIHGWTAGTPGLEMLETTTVGDRFGRTPFARLRLTEPGVIVGPSPTGPVVLGQVGEACRPGAAAK